MDKNNRKWLKPPQIEAIIGLVDAEQEEDLKQKIQKGMNAQLSDSHLLSIPTEDLREEVKLMFKRQLSLYMKKKVYVSSQIITV